jgi:hypothetical protein
MIVAQIIYVLLVQALTPAATQCTQAGVQAQKQAHSDRNIEGLQKMIALEMPLAEEACDVRSALLAESQTSEVPAKLARADELAPNTPPSLLALGGAAA